MAQIALIAPPTFIAITTGRGKHHLHELSYARKKPSFPLLVESRKMEKSQLFVSSNSGDERSRSVAVKVSEGGAISLPHGWPPQKKGSEDQIEGINRMKSSNRFFTVALVAAWYSSNIGVLLLNKYLLSNYGFKYPIFLTMCHMTACSLLSYVAIAWMKLVPLQTIRSRVQFFKISALSLVFCVSVVFGNISLRYLPVSFNQAIGATTPFFTAVFAYLMTFKREAWLTYLALVPVVTGVIIASGGEPSFHLFGFIICVAATGARALKSVLQGILLSSEGEKLNSMNLLLYMAPMAVVFLLPATLIMEENVVGITLALARDDSKIIWYLLFNSALAYFVNLTNFLVTKHTSALTLQVLGNAKGAVAVVVSILIFRNPVSVTGMMGYSLTVFGVILYSEAKKRSK
ncbi:probable sugar phosphate/phosphate translocator At3g11320 [Vigna radiata var. radiata]|uniref:Probable sugar phosphate/phosphate translocator At3g11320 n=1 Tax=Vigna radiata var. radiata TaxID=3916 RepID=A0A1S3TQW0_VIGRR|nr:probable sugar phosphate/phosphate translocator At3g11320 [Vigna radiata var. radiata]